MRTTAWLAALGSVLALGAAAEEEPFEIIELPAPGRTAAAGLADLDGDGRTDVFHVGLTGVPPKDRRELRIHYQRPDGKFLGIPDWSGTLLKGAAAYDVADFPDGPGEELLLLHRDGVAVLSFSGRQPRQRELVPARGPTVAVAPDERGLDRMRLVRTEFSDGPLLLVPGLGDCTVMRPDGQLLGRLDVGHRANYFIPPRPGPLIGENEIEQFYDYPRLDLGDVDGDGRVDVISANRHEIRTFLRRPDGSFASAPSQHLAIGRLTEKDQIRGGSANVRVASADFDGDGSTDLLMSHISGGLLDARTETTIHLNRGGTWNLEEPDQTFLVKKHWNSWLLLDLDGDGRVELFEAQIPLSVLELVEVLVTRAVDVDVRIRRHNGHGGFEEKPWIRRRLDISFSFETFEPKGFFPTFDADLNGDGFKDRLSSGEGREIVVSLGGGDDPYGDTEAHQKMDTTGALRFGDLDGNGLPDFILYDRTRPGIPLRIGRNRGVLPGTRRRLELRASGEE